MLTRFTVSIYLCRYFDCDTRDESWRPENSEPNLEDVGAITVRADNPRYAAALAYSKSYGPERLAFFDELGAPRELRHFYAAAAILRGLRRSWFYSQRLAVRFQFERPEPCGKLYFAVHNASRLHRDRQNCPFSRN